MMPGCKPKLLYITRRWPARTGGGTVMRGGILIEALAATHDVYALIVNSGGVPEDRRMDCAEWCKRVEYCRVDEVQHEAYRGLRWRGDPENLLAAELASPLTFFESTASDEAVAMAAKVYEDVAFETVHISRLHMAAFARPYLASRNGTRPRRITLDLDDIESKTHARLAGLHRSAGNSVYARIHTIEAEKHLRLEREWIPRFDEVWVCSDEDRTELEANHRHAAAVTIPNAVRIPGTAPPQRSARLPTLFFIGNFAYFPNEDALLFFLSAILPLIRKRLGRPFRFVIAGAGVSDVPSRLSVEPEVVVAGEVPDVAPYYDGADVVIAPIRAGGGTRIKILEAFSFHKPVIATPLAAEGLHVTHGVELLLGSSPAEFAGACAALLANQGLCADLARRAFDFVRSRHSLESLTSLFARRCNSHSE